MNERDITHLHNPYNPNRTRTRRRHKIRRTQRPHALYRVDPPRLRGRLPLAVGFPFEDAPEGEEVEGDGEVEEEAEGGEG